MLVTEGEEDLEEEEGEGRQQEADSHFTTLAKFSREFLDVLAEPNEPLSEEDRKSKPLVAAQKDYKDVLRLLQVITRRK